MAALELFRTGDVRGFLWIKAVTGVALTQHCAAALTGDYLPVDRHAGVQQLVLPAAPAWYLCGVTDPFRYAGNDHLLLLPDPAAQSATTVRTPGYTVRLHGVRAQPFGLRDVPAFAPLGTRDRYRTCRCWQAGWWLRRHLFRPFPAGPPAGPPSSRPATPKASA